MISEKLIELLFFRVRTKRFTVLCVQMLVVALLCVSCAFAWSAAPAVNGLPGNMIYHLSSTGFPCDDSAVTVFGNAGKVPSGDGKYNLVVPTGNLFSGINVHFADDDYVYPDQGDPYVWQNNDSTYRVTGGFPFLTPIILDSDAGSVSSFGISGNFTDVPPGCYPTTITVTDNGSSTYDGVVDAPLCFLGGIK